MDTNIALTLARVVVEATYPVMSLAPLVLFPALLIAILFVAFKGFRCQHAHVARRCSKLGLLAFLVGVLCLLWNLMDIGVTLLSEGGSGSGTGVFAIRHALAGIVSLYLGTAIFLLAVAISTMFSDSSREDGGHRVTTTDR